jgi:hypothetical protein
MGIFFNIAIYVVAALTGVLRQLYIASSIPQNAFGTYSDLVLVSSIALGFGCGGKYVQLQSELPLIIAKGAGKIVKRLTLGLLGWNLVSLFAVILVLVVFDVFFSLGFRSILVGAFLGASQLAFNIVNLPARCAGDIRAMSWLTAIRSVGIYLVAICAIKMDLGIVCLFFIEIIFTSIVVCSKYYTINPPGWCTGTIPDCSGGGTVDEKLGSQLGFFSQMIVSNMYSNYDRSLGRMLLDERAYGKLGLILTVVGVGLNVQPILASLQMKIFSKSFVQDGLNVVIRKCFNQFYFIFAGVLALTLALFKLGVGLMNQYWPQFSFTGVEVLLIALVFIVRISDSFSIYLLISGLVRKIINAQVFSVVISLCYLIVARVVFKIEFTCLVLITSNLVAAISYISFVAFYTKSSRYNPCTGFVPSRTTHN